MQGKARAGSPRTLLATAAVLAVLVSGAAAAEQAGQGSITGTVVDPLGARVAAASVTLAGDGSPVAEGTSDAQGQFTFPGLTPGRYEVVVKASGFDVQRARAVFVGAGSTVAVAVALQIGLKQEVVVTASATEEPASQVGAPVTVIDRGTLDDLAKLTVSEALRLVPGSLVTQAGGRGGNTALLVRGGNPNFNKVLVDGIPINDIGGGFDYSDFTTTGVERVEALRDANSVLYGSDAMAGVISITTRRGQSRKPELSGSFDAGNLETSREEAAVGGTAQRFDYFGAYAHFATDNDTPNNDYQNDTFVGRVGYALGGAGDISATFRHARSDYGVPNGIDLFGIADDSRQKGASTSIGVIAQSRLTPAWHGVLRLASFKDDYDLLNPTPTGEPFDPFGFGPNYLGNTVTIDGANGTSATGQAILDFGGAYPQPFKSQARRQLAAAQATYQAASPLALSAGVRFEHEEGFSDSGTVTSSDRDNYGSFLEARAKLRRFYATAGIGYEHNEVFESAWTPRLSAAFYLREPSSTGSLGDTKAIFNVGRGIKAPSVAQETSSLFALLALAPNVTAPVSPIGPERSRGLDAGIEQGLWRGQVRVRASYFDNKYSDLIEFLDQTALARLGVPADVIAATAFGAYVNSGSYRAQGLEASAEAALGGDFRVMASYTYLDARVSESFSSSALGPVENESYPGVPIGAFGPLVGARPFRRPAHSGNLLLTYAHGPAQVSLAGYFVGKSDDSTFLSDGFFGNSLLLPNKDLDAGYQKMDLSGSYRLLQSRLKLYFSAENVFDQHYASVFGFPALPRTIRVGVTGTLGGDGARRP